MRTINIEIAVPLQHLFSYVQRADIRHWGEMTQWIPATLHLQTEEHNSRKIVRSGVEDWQRGLEIMARTLPHHFRDLVADTGDAYTGNLLVQCVAFGEVRYE